MIFRRAAFDLARRFNRDLRNVPRMPELLRPILIYAEQADLGLALGRSSRPLTWPFKRRNRSLRFAISGGRKPGRRGRTPCYSY